MKYVARRQVLKGLGLAGLALSLPGGALAATSQELASEGLARLQEGKTAQALAALKEAAKLDPANAWVFNLLGRSYYTSGQQRLAADNFRLALRIDPADGYSRMMLDVLAQHPLPPAPAEKPGKSKRLSQLEEQARDELSAFAKTGKAPGKRLLLIDPGHGGADKGVTGTTGLVEKDLTLDVATLLAAELNASDAFRAMLTRQADYAVPLWARKAQADLFGAELMISLHCAASLPGYAGVEVYSYSGAASDAEANAVAELENGVLRFERVQPPVLAEPASQRGLLGAWRVRSGERRGKELAESLAAKLTLPGTFGPAHARQAPLRVLEGPRCPSMLIEMGFLSNTQEEKALKGKEFQAVLARTLAQGLTRILG
ncbi:N-acetylmuramoyl-L-alanine amidase [Fundidesulfovibrio soli]|uniref:N-acetylmuramoyl-L-alanine amidase n=1 Tax=Fundidesulfovibrio soli TaxID=2922716 RepID=UPI001FAEA364|nr:N-acetylmuramoyl-L-alanine amidase [Fundidesulfovibrio soli]